MHGQGGIGEAKPHVCAVALSSPPASCHLRGGFAGGVVPKAIETFTNEPPRRTRALTHRINLAQREPRSSCPLPHYTSSENINIHLLGVLVVSRTNYS